MRGWVGAESVAMLLLLGCGGVLESGVVEEACGALPEATPAQVVSW